MPLPIKVALAVCLIVSIASMGYLGGRFETFKDFQSGKCWVNKRTLDVECIVYLD